MDPTGLNRTEIEVLHKIDLMQKDPTRRLSFGTLENGTVVSKIELTDKDLIEIGKALTSGFYGKLSLTQKAKSKLKQKALTFLEKAYYTSTTHRVQTVAQGSADRGASALTKKTVQVTSISQKDPALVEAVERQYAAYQLRDALQGKPANHWITSLMKPEDLTPLRSKSTVDLATNTPAINDLLNSWNQLDKAHRKDPVLFRELLPSIPQNTKLEQTARLLMEAIDLHSKLPTTWSSKKKNDVALAFATAIQTRPFPNILKPFLGGKELTSTDMANFQGMLRSRLSSDLRSYPGDADKTLASLTTRFTAYEFEEFASRMHSISAERGRIADGIVNVLRQRTDIVSGHSAVDQQRAWPTIKEFIELHRYFEGSRQGKDQDGVIWAETPETGIPLTLSHLQRVNQRVIQHLIEHLRSLEVGQSRQAFLSKFPDELAAKLSTSLVPAAPPEVRQLAPPSKTESRDPSGPLQSQVLPARTELAAAPASAAPKRRWGGPTLKEQLDEANAELERLRGVEKELLNVRDRLTTAQKGNKEKEQRITELSAKVDSVSDQLGQKGIEIRNTKSELAATKRRADQAEQSLESVKRSADEWQEAALRANRQLRQLKKQLKKLTSAREEQEEALGAALEEREALKESDALLHDIMHFTESTVKKDKQLKELNQSLSTTVSELEVQIAAKAKELQALHDHILLQARLTPLVNDLSGDEQIGPEFNAALQLQGQSLANLHLLIVRDIVKAQEVISTVVKQLITKDTVKDGVKAILEKHAQVEESEEPESPVAADGTESVGEEEEE